MSVLTWLISYVSNGHCATFSEISRVGMKIGVIFDNYHPSYVIHGIAYTMCNRWIGDGILNKRRPRRISGVRIPELGKTEFRRDETSTGVEYFRKILSSLNSSAGNRRIPDSNSSFSTLIPRHYHFRPTGADIIFYVDTSIAASVSSNCLHSNTKNRIH